MSMTKPGWIDSNTLIDTVNHPCKQVWIEEHRNLVTGERVYLVCRPDADSEFYTNFIVASNAVGEEFGFVGTWKKL
jgi:hypothetical protein